MNLTLIGMSGAGKSYIGKRVAEELGFDFVDVDQEIEREEGRILPELLEEWGDERFIAHESDATIRTTKGKDNTVISTAGSVIYGPEAMEHLQAISKIVYLAVPAAAIIERIGGSADRMGRIVRLNGRTLEELMEERIPLYEKYADHTVVTHGKVFEELVPVVAALC